MLASQSEAEILQRVIRPEVGDMPHEAAKQLLKLDFTESDHRRMAELSAKAQEGKLSGSEQEELESYINVSHFLAFVQSKARQSLKGENGNTSAA